MKKQVSTTVLPLKSVEERIIVLRGERVILDSDVAALYGVATKAVNQAVKNNLDKFPPGYVLTLSTEEKSEVVKNFDHLQNLRFSHAIPSAFTEKGLYMLVTILKSRVATRTTIAIVEAFASLRELSRTMSLVAETEDKGQQQTLLKRSGHLITELISQESKSTETEFGFELNLAVLKLKGNIKRK
jgi:hypothetical protein